MDVRVIAALDQSISEELVTRYQTEVEHRFRQQDPLLRSTLIHSGAQAPEGLLRAAARRGVVLKTFAQYQGLVDFTRYLDWQTRWLEADQVYPPWLYVEQPARVSLAGGREEQATARALDTLWDLLDVQHPRFALVLGDFGAGKTFLLHELARRMATGKHPLVPVLVEMSKLEKQRSLKALLAQHFALADVGRTDLDAFQYMLAEGRIALLFDGVRRAGAARDVRPRRGALRDGAGGGAGERQGGAHQPDAALLDGPASEAGPGGAGGAGAGVPAISTGEVRGRRRSGGSWAM